ncbi:MAG: hypothetical protein N2205_09985 [Candidatus Caldatribacterium sp.]|nr:hypothetical protein [Candidatus Caldatribacterium sp.]
MSSWGKLFALVFIFCIVTPVLAREEAIELEGARLIYRWSDEEVWVLQGKLTYKDVTLTADEIRVFLRKEELEARGHVRVTRKDEGFTAEEVVYNWGKDFWRSKGILSEITGKGVRGKLFFRGAFVEEKDDTMTIEGARATGCDLPEPHYFFEAKRIVIYPNKKVILYNLSYYDFGRKLFSLPSYAFFLNRKEQLPFLPLVGYSRDVGYYLTYYHNYFSGDTVFGTIEASFWEKVGWKLAVTHYIENEKREEQGKFYVEYLDKRNASPSLAARGEYSRKLSEFLRLSSNFAYTKTLGEANDVFSAQALLTYKEKGIMSRLSASYAGDMTRKSDTISAVWTTAYDFGGMVAGVNFVFREDSRFGAYTDQDLQYEFSLKKTVGKYTYILRYTGHEDPEGDAYLGDFVRFVRKIPELEVVREKERLGKSDITYKIGVILGHYAEEDTGVVDERLSLSLDLEGKSPLGRDLYFTPKFRFEQNFYGNGFARYAFSGSFLLEGRLSETTSVALGYNRAGYAGATPFRFDYTTPKSVYWSLGLFYGRGPWSVRFESGYDAMRGVFDEGIVHVGYRESDEKNVEVRGSYDFNAGTFSEMRVRLSWPLSQEWSVGLEGGWDLTRGELESLRVRLTRDLHCRTVSLFYDRSEDTFWLEYSLKAFPEQAVRLGGE